MPEHVIPESVARRAESAREALGKTASAPPPGKTDGNEPSMDLLIVVLPLLLMLIVSSALLARELRRGARRRWARVAALATLTVAALSFVAWLAVPSEWAAERCYDDASRRPSEIGTNLALQMCRRKYPDFRLQ